MATMIFDGAEYDIRWEIIDPLLARIEAATMPGGFTTIELSFDSGDVHHFVWTPGVPITFKCSAKEMLLRLGRP
jgi:hypothetical protein